MENLISVQTTARYYVRGKISKKNRALWFVFHGYAMRADEFIEEFVQVVDEQTLVVAPEGFHRFYSRGTRGSISANWMTSELREYDIENNMQYLNQIIKDLRERGLRKSVKIGVIGFSQGGSTAIRWVSQLEDEINLLIAWATDIPKDVLNDAKKLRKINTSGLKLVVGDNDEYLCADKIESYIIELHDSGVDFDFHTFKGGHELHEKTIRYFHARLLDEPLEY